MINKKHFMRRSQFASVLFFSYFAAIALSMTFKKPSFPDRYNVSIISEILWNLHYSLSNTAMESTLLFICLAYLGQWIESRKQITLKAIPVVSIFIAVIWLMGCSYRIDNTLYHLHATYGQAVKSVIYLVGITWLIQQSFYLLFVFIHQSPAYPAAPAQTKCKAFFVRHTFAIPMVLLIVCWLPHILISYPAYMCIDSWSQLFQAFHVFRFTSHHPPAHSALIGLVVWLGMFVKDGEFGLFLFVILQAICGSAAIAYAIHTMRKLSSPKWLIILSFLAGVFVPYYSGYVNVILKDNLYSYAFLVFMTEIIYMLILKDRFFKSPRHTVLYIASTISVLLLRNNGKYIIYPFFVILFACYCVNCCRLKERRKYIVNIALFMLLPILCTGFISNFLESRFDIAPGSIREAFSLPFQQTARYVETYPEEVTEEEKTAISAVLDFDNLAELYDPRISDPVKNTFNDEASASELIRYLSVWIKQFFKHPMVYVHATVNQNYYLLYPAVENNIVYSQTYWEAYKDKYPKTEGFQDAVPEQPSEIRIEDNGFQLLMFSIPVIGALSSPAVYNIILIGLCIFAIYMKKLQWLLAVIPVILSNFVIILAPVIQGTPRYAFPIVFSLPILIAFYIFLQNNKCDKGDVA